MKIDEQAQFKPISSHTIQNRVLYGLFFLLVLSFILVTGLPAYSTISVFIGMVLVMAYAFIWLVRKDMPLYMNTTLRIYTIFFIIVLASILWATDQNLAFFMIPKILYIWIILITVYNIVKNYDVDNAFNYAIITGIWINFIIYFGVVKLPFDTWLWLRYQGTTGNPNLLAIIAIFSIFSSMIALYVSNRSRLFKLLHLTNILMSVFLIMATASKKGMLLGALLIATYVLFNRNKFKIMLYGVVITLVILTGVIQFVGMELFLEKISFGLVRLEKTFNVMSGMTNDVSTSERMTFIFGGLDKFSDQPIFGHGINNFRHYFGLYAHNNYIELLFDVGIVGTLTYYMMFVLLLIKLTRFKDKFLQYMFTSVILIILAMDLAFVSYYNKFYLVYFIVLSYHIEKYKFYKR